MLLVPKQGCRGPGLVFVVGHSILFLLRNCLLIVLIDIGSFSSIRLEIIPHGILLPRSHLPPEQVSCILRASCQNTQRNQGMVTWKPSEIVVHDAVRDDPATQFFLEQCSDTPVKYVSSGTPNAVVKASDVLTRLEGTMLDKILLAKQVVYIAPVADAVDVFTMPDDRMACPHF